MRDKQESATRFPLRLTLAQRKVIAQACPGFSDRLKLDELNQRLVPFSLDEMRAIRLNARFAIRQTDSGMKRNSLRHVAYLAEKAVEEFKGIGRIPVKERLYQFKITLKDLKPPIWRRIQTRDCTLDKLHDRIQTALGWTNSHLHHFQINETLYGDPWLINENFDDFGYEDSTITTLSHVLPKSGARFRFEYEYDFGDSWWHEVLFEGCLRADPGRRYPLCVEGERACPPEDVGGTSGYEDFLKAIAVPDDPEHDENLTWVGGSFDPEHFDPEKATKRMIRGLPKWRETAY
jgi:Plasmid pRiA4b ORF-3-like protein